jgi:hypothetical protein
MLRMKSLFAVLVLAAIAGIVPMAQAQTVKVVIAGSSAMWQTMALGAYNSGTSIVSGGGATGHWTSASNKVNLTDTRPSPVNVDPGTMWVVWDSAAAPGPNVWVYLKVDSVVGVRCYFAQPHCNVSGASADITTSGSNQISTTLWGDGSSDSSMPAAVAALFTSPTSQLVNVAATDIRPEDAAFAECRVNSQLGNGTPGSGDGVDGLGYGTKNPGICPVKADPQSAKVGSPITSGLTGSTSAANVLAFNISGTDPFSGTTIPTPTTTSVGAAPIVFMIERDKGQLTNLANATETQLQDVFSGTNCDASAFGLSSGAINIFLREPLSGTMNTTEATVFRRPTVPASQGVLGESQELHVGTHNPLKGQAGTCLAGSGARYRAIGTGEAVSGVQHSGDGTKVSTVSDGIGYAFFSYGNVNAIAGSTNYGYITLNGIDPIFQSYGSTIDPGQPTNSGVLPKASNLPPSCGGNFPCSEHSIWSNGFSFPNLRNGTYRAWSLLRVVSSGTPNTNAKALITASQKYVVNTVPDYVPAATVAGTTDLGLKLVRSHYQQKDGNGGNIGSAPINTGADKGGDMGGQILPTLAGVTTSKQTQLIQSSNSDSSNLGPALR